MYQDHYASLPELEIDIDFNKVLPIVGKDIKSSFSIEKNKDEYATVTSKPHEGSYKTSLTIRSNGTRVTVTGNPSKYGRLDNLFGYQSIDECVELYNEILPTYGLPPFSKATYLEPSQLVEGDGTSISLLHNGAVFNRFDITRNYMTGSESTVLPALASLSAHTSGRMIPNLYSNGRTVDWKSEQARGKSKGSQYDYLKAYDKAYEMSLHKPKFELTLEEQNYLRELENYIKEMGTIRLEDTMRYRKLKRHGAHIYGIATEERLNKLFEEKATVMTKNEATVTSYQNVKNDLLSRGIVDSPKTATRLQHLVYAWLSGENVRAGCSESTFYANRKLLLELSIDIKQPFDISRMTPKIRMIKHTNILQPPSFYRYPSLIAQVTRVA